MYWTARFTAQSPRSTFKSGCRRVSSNAGWKERWEFKWSFSICIPFDSSSKSIAINAYQWLYIEGADSSQRADLETSSHVILIGGLQSLLIFSLRGHHWRTLSSVVYGCLPCFLVFLFKLFLLMFCGCLFFIALICCSLFWIRYPLKFLCTTTYFGSWVHLNLREKYS